MRKIIIFLLLISWQLSVGQEIRISMNPSNCKSCISYTNNLVEYAGVDNVSINFYNSDTKTANFIADTYFPNFVKAKAITHTNDAGFNDEITFKSKNKSFNIREVGKYMSFIRDSVLLLKKDTFFIPNYYSPQNTSFAVSDSFIVLTDEIFGKEYVYSVSRKKLVDTLDYAKMPIKVLWKKLHMLKGKQLDESFTILQKQGLEKVACSFSAIKNDTILSLLTFYYSNKENDTLFTRIGNVLLERKINCNDKRYIPISELPTIHPGYGFTYIKDTLYFVAGGSSTTPLCLNSVSLKNKFSNKNKFIPKQSKMTRDMWFFASNGHLHSRSNQIYEVVTGKDLTPDSCSLSALANQVLVYKSQTLKVIRRGNNIIVDTLKGNTSFQTTTIISPSHIKVIGNKLFLHEKNKVVIISII